MKTMQFPRPANRIFDVRVLLVPAISLVLSACGGDQEVAAVPGPSPFISMLHIGTMAVNSITSVEYTIAPKPGSVSKPVHVQYSIAALKARGDVANSSVFTVPIFGLYAGYDNQVSLVIHKTDGSTTSLAESIQTDPYTDPTGIYSNPTILTARAAGSPLGFDFIYLKSALGSPVIIDTDGAIRWVAPGVSNSTSSKMLGDEFVVGDQTSTTVYRMRMDGTVAQGALSVSGAVPNLDVADFSHDIRPGKTGLIAGVDTLDNGVKNLDSSVIEFSKSDVNSVIKKWDLGAILTAYMSSQGDDPSLFVRPGVDWFHQNSSIYDPSDDSVIISSRENFVIKLDYATGNIIWILGDPTKYWYTFPSLRAKAITLAPGALYPVGQHGISITSDGLLMLFNDGLGSVNQPAGAPDGISRTYSAVSAYSIDESTMTATNPWNYDAGQAIYSAYCGSAFEAGGTGDESILVDYPLASGGTKTILVGLNPQFQTVFSLGYNASGSCNTAWNARPIPLDNLVINQ